MEQQQQNEEELSTRVFTTLAMTPRVAHGPRMHVSFPFSAHLHGFQSLGIDSKEVVVEIHVGQSRLLVFIKMVTSRGTYRMDYGVLRHVRGLSVVETLS